MSAGYGKDKGVPLPNKMAPSAPAKKAAKGSMSVKTKAPKKK